MKSKIVINSIGIIFLIFGIAAIINTILNIEKRFAPILWLSYICLILLAIGVLRKDSSLIASQITIIGIPYLLWNIDFFYQLITKSSLLGITDYLFKSVPITDKIISLQHIFNLPLSLIALHLIKLKRTDFWIISITQITIVFIISRLTTTYKENVNCVYHNCANFSFGLPYILEWFLAYLIMITLTSYLIKKIFYKKIK
ncbi:hypothetical protein J4423_03055 [Candidatus Pacearchaeota archaeon]|nr:hypothetical protein [Candidatus Pacearchaeota archaeon]